MYSTFVLKSAAGFQNLKSVAECVTEIFFFFFFFLNYYLTFSNVSKFKTLPKRPEKEIK
jgi:hypothetical protein